MLPSPATLRNQVKEYLADSDNLTSASIKKAAASAVFPDIYRASLATHTILGGLSGSRLHPTLAPARSIAVRVPLLVAIGQSSVASAELRRFLELALWTIYFTDHPIEWRVFLNNKSKGFAQDIHQPISYAAHRQLNAYLDYAGELMGAEPSGLGKTAIEGLRQVVWELNSMVHAGRIAREARKLPPQDDVSETALRSFLKIQRATFSNCCILLCAYRREKFDKLNAVSRSYFDWLVGPSARKRVRAGPFGISFA